MSCKLPKEVLSSLSALISSLMGLHFPEQRYSDLERGVVAAARDFGFSDTLEFIRWLNTATLSRHHIEALAANLTVGETYFFRDTDSFKALEESILPAIVSSRREASRLRIWSAGCSTGEEPYSIAILLKRMSHLFKGWNVTIIGTDINAKALKRASDGVYTEWSFRGTPQWLKDGYFRKKDGFYEITPEIRQMVSFSFLNLAEDAYPSLLSNTSAMDMILCRNVLMYFSPEVAGRVIHGFHNSLLEGGYLFLSPTEGLRMISYPFKVMNLGNTTVYRKDAGEGAKDRFESKSPPLWQVLKHSAENGGMALGSDGPAVTEEAGGPSRRGDETAARPLPAGPAPQTSSTTDAERLLKEGRYAEAARVLESVVSVKGTDEPATGLLARAYANQGQLDLAAEWCEKAIAADNLDPMRHYLLATILQEQGRPEDAVKSLRKALYLDHDFVLAHFVLGNLLVRLGDGDGAVRQYRNALRLTSKMDADEVIPESDGVTAGRLSEIIDSITREKAF
ncbi:MAG: tetratricopeptide repeat protein [Deltaproteobacteria bacterium]|nr:tetratricopeptide repeat protein [Deltaproteobacteria bacterium]